MIKIALTVESQVTLLETADQEESLEADLMSKHLLSKISVEVDTEEENLLEGEMIVEIDLEEMIAETEGETILETGEGKEAALIQRE